MCADTYSIIICCPQILGRSYKNLREITSLENMADRDVRKAELERKKAKLAEMKLAKQRREVRDSTI
jgi:hypothetical protein